MSIPLSWPDPDYDEDQSEHESGAHDDERYKYAAIGCAGCQDHIDTLVDQAMYDAEQAEERKQNDGPTDT